MRIVRRTTRVPRRISSVVAAIPPITLHTSARFLAEVQGVLEVGPPSQMLMYGTDTFWPVDPEMYREQYLQPQLGLFEIAATLGHIVQEGSPAREEYRDMIFFQNAFSHWQNAIKEPQRPRPAPDLSRSPTLTRDTSEGRRRNRLLR